VTFNSGGSRYPDREDPGQLGWWDGSQHPGYSGPGSPSGPSTPLPGGTGGTPRERSKGWVLWSGAAAVTALVLGITLVVAMHHSAASTPAAQSARSGQHSSGSGSTGSNPPASQSQLCQSVVDPLYQQSLQSSGNSSGNLPQVVNSYRQAARRASSDPALADDLNAVADGFQKVLSDMSSLSNTAATENDMRQEGQDMEALWQLCPP
jgi:hypothetical protein